MHQQQKDAHQLHLRVVNTCDDPEPFKTTKAQGMCARAPSLRSRFLIGQHTCTRARAHTHTHGTQHARVHELLVDGRTRARHTGRQVSAAL